MRPIPRTPSLWREFAAIVMRKRRPSALAAANYPVGERFQASNGPASSILVPLVLVGLCADVPLSLVIVALYHPRHPLLVHLAVAVIGLWPLGWAIAARSTLRSLPHVVSNDALWIGGGIRLSGVIPKAAIARVLAVRVSRHEWMGQQGVRSDDVVLAIGFDPPNVAVEISAAASDTVRIGSRRGHVPIHRWVLLYADNPNAVMAATSLIDAAPIVVPGSEFPAEAQGF